MVSDNYTFLLSSRTFVILRKQWNLHPDFQTKHDKNINFMIMIKISWICPLHDPKTQLQVR